MVLNGWKEIARHLGCGIRTAQRWEVQGLGLPIHRPKHDGGVVVAFSEEIDEWLKNTPGRALVEENGNGRAFRYKVLIVDDDDRLRASVSALVGDAGYDVRSASDGFEALAVMREGGVPDLLISDLKMPNMSGFELLTVVRRRFPAIAVVAMSGDFTPATPPAVLADAFLAKGAYTGEQLVQVVQDLLSQSPIRAQLAKHSIAPAWIPLDGSGYVVVTCNDCLRSFSLPISDIEHADTDITRDCIHCGVSVPFRLDTTVREILKSKLKAKSESRTA